MFKNCYCGRCALDTESADLVVNNRPLCDPDCINRARADRRAARDVRIGQSWAFNEHRTQAEVGFDVVR
jgi:hypothetical protein